MWYQFDGPDDERGDELDALEKTALDAIKAIVRLADTQPDRALVIGASLRKIWTVSQANAQSLHLRSVTVKRVKQS